MIDERRRHGSTGALAREQSAKEGGQEIKNVTHREDCCKAVGQESRPALSESGRQHAGRTRENGQEKTSDKHVNKKARKR